MTQVFHSSLEAAQHGDKDLGRLARFARSSGCKGVQPSNFHLQSTNGSFMSSTTIKERFGETMKLDGISAHCPFWVHGAAGTGTKTIRPFIPPDVAKLSVEKIEAWALDYCRRLMELSAQLGNKVMPMFWGPYWGLEVASGYPWGMWSGGDYDLIAEGNERFVKKTAVLRQHANSLGISLAHEIHRGTGALCADDFLNIIRICDGDKCLGVNADPSHCWENEDFETRFTKVGPYVTGCHVKDMVVIPGRSVTSMEPNWGGRGMQFTRLGTGDLDLHRYAKLMLEIGYPQRYCALQDTETAPLVGEAEDAHWDLDATSSDAARFIREELCRDVGEGSFEDGMGDQTENT